MSLANTGLYAGLAGLMLIVLSVRVIQVRRARGLSAGDGGDAELKRRIRAHGNFCEYAPLALILLAAVEGAGHPAWLVHGLGICLLAGRVSHAWSMTAGSIRARVAGMSATFLVLGVGSVAAIAGFL
jgi:hypothetical protein